MRRIGLICSVLSVIICVDVWSAVTNFIVDSSIKDFNKGQFENIALDRNGNLSLSPGKKKIFSKEDILFVWCATLDSRGNSYFGTGNKARIYRKSKDGKVKLYYSSKKGISITSLVIDSNDNLYASVTPGSNIIKIKPNGSSSLFATLKESYIWNLKRDSHNNIIAATGNSASIYKITRKGQVKSLFSSKEEPHFLALNVDKDDNIYFGSEGKGILYKWSAQTQKVQVLYDSYEDEIRDITFDSKGNIYFCTASKIAKHPPKTFTYTDTFFRYGSPNKKTKQTITSKKAPLKNSVYKISKTGAIQKLMTRDNTIFLSLVVDKEGNLYAGSGDEGIIYKIKGVNDASIFIDTDELQVLFLMISNNKLIVTTGNIGKVFEIGLRSSNKGTYHSRIFNTSGNSYWGKIKLKTDEHPNTKITFQTRTGHTSIPDKTWSRWSKKYTNIKGELITSPPAQYIQYKVIFHRSKGKPPSPILKKVLISYLLENRAPEIENILLKKEPKKQLFLIGPYSKTLSPSVFTLSWNSSDRDQDFLTYSIYFREKQSEYWILLKEEITKKNYSFDARRLPDGDFYFKVVASDEKSNDHSRAKTGFKVSSFFRIDNSPPKIMDIKIQQQGHLYEIRGKAFDKQSMIKVIQYSLNGRNWIYLGPQDLIYDSKEETFKITLDPNKEKNIFKGKNIIIFRVADSFDNFMTYEVTFIRK